MATTLTGTAGPDVFSVAGDDFTISTLGGDDTVFTGTGNDFITGGFGSDTICGFGMRRIAATSEPAWRLSY